MDSRTFREEVIAVINQIPQGLVMTYGQVAAAAGKPRHARAVGDILFGISTNNDLPWWRVINSSGKLSTYKVGTGELQRALLESEGVVFAANGSIDLGKYRWKSEAIGSANSKWGF